MKIKVTADSTCDLSAEVLNELDITMMPIHILMGGQEYLDCVTVHPADIFAHVKNGGEPNKTAAPNMVEYVDFFAPFAEQYDAVIHVAVGGKYSSCYPNASLAAESFDNVTVIDSNNICTGQGYLVVKAARWARDGLPALTIARRLKSLAKQVELSFVLDRLDLLAKSGRCSSILAFGANLLKIKPSLENVDGELKVEKKYRGALSACVARYVEDRLAGRDDIDNSLVFISSCEPLPGCVEALREGLAKYGHFEEIIETDIGSTVGGYSGPGTIGIVFARKK